MFLNLIICIRVEIVFVIGYTDIILSILGIRIYVDSVLLVTV